MHATGVVKETGKKVDVNAPAARDPTASHAPFFLVLVHQRPRPAAVHIPGIFAVLFLHVRLIRASRRALAKSSKVGVTFSCLLRPACFSAKSLCTYYAFAGWDQGCLGMKKGEVRKLVIPADEGYGAAGFPAWGIHPGGACNS